MGNELTTKVTPQAPQTAPQGTEHTRVIAEVQARTMQAVGAPRNVNAAYTRIMQACERESLARKAMYSYPRGGQAVTGPSIRLAEVLAQNWGNIECGVKELSQANGESVMEAYAWDLETNFRDSKTFTVPHVRHTRQGKKPLTDPRDIYEMSANNGSRRKRACILAVIPADIIEAAVDACRQTMESNLGKNIEDATRNMLVGFKKLGVTQEHIEKKLEHPAENITAPELVELGNIFNAIKDGSAKAEEYFEIKTKQKVDPKEFAAKLAQGLDPTKGEKK